MSSKEKLFKQMMQKKKSVAKEVEKEAAVGLDVVNTSVNTPVNTCAEEHVNETASISVNARDDTPVIIDECLPVDLSGSICESSHVDAHETGGVNESVNTSVEEDESDDASAHEDEYISEDENTFGDNSGITLGDISAFASTSVDARNLQKKLKSKAKKVKFEESHVKRTLWLTKENNDILNLERKNGGNVTKELNSAIRLWFNLKSKGLIEEED